MIYIVKFTQEIKPTHTNVVGEESMMAGHAMPISPIFLFYFSFYDCFCNTRKCSYPVKRTPKCSKGGSFVASRAMRFLTCRAQHTAKNTSNFNLVRDVLVCGDIQANPGPKKTKPSPKYPCGECNKAARNNQEAILCVGCNKWSHAK